VYCCLGSMATEVGTCERGEWQLNSAVGAGSKISLWRQPSRMEAELPAQLCVCSLAAAMQRSQAPSVRKTLGVKRRRGKATHATGRSAAEIAATRAAT